MPVNMDPTKKHRRTVPPNSGDQVPGETSQKQPAGGFGEETEEDRIKALADAEKKNLWDATEVIDMDRW